MSCEKHEKSREKHDEAVLHNIFLTHFPKIMQFVNNLKYQSIYSKKLLAFISTVLIDYLFSIKQQVVVSPDGDKPQRKMREAAADFKSDLKSGEKLEILDVFVLKLPDADSH